MVAISSKYILQAACSTFPNASVCAASVSGMEVRATGAVKNINAFHQTNKVTPI